MYRQIRSLFSLYHPKAHGCRGLKYDRRESVENSKLHVQKALDYFDETYGSFYGNMWPSMRLALLSQPKYCALVNYYSDYESTLIKLTDLGCVEIQNLYSEYSKNRNPSKRKRRTNKYTSNKSNNVIETPDEEKATEELSLSSDRIILPGSANSALMNFVPANKLKGVDEDTEEDPQYFQGNSDFSLKVEHDEEISFPQLIKAFMFPRGDVTSFPSPRGGSMRTLDYYLMDAASLLPVLALNILPMDSVLDLCAAPGGKTLTILQTLYPSRLVSNDVTSSRVSRLKNVLHQYLGRSESWNDRLAITKCDARCWQDVNMFDKVLVDVPCTVDRHSVNEQNNNIFKTGRNTERMKIPELQTSLLCAGVRACKPGGTVVYSTCSLSPIQNDGVVYVALKQLQERHGIQVVVKDISKTMENFDFMVRSAPPNLIRYGHQVIPSIPNNFGPMYIAKLQRST